MIQLQQVSCQYEADVPVLQAVSFSIARGETVGLIGANGSGKTTLSKLMLGLLPFSGRICIDGLDVCKKNLAAIRRNLGYVFQDSDSQLFMPTVGEDLCFGLRNYGMSAAAAAAQADRTLADLGLLALRHRANHKLSGGEKRMAAIATVLAIAPTAVILDEPSNGLDPYNRRAVIRAINQLTCTRLVISHDLDLVLDTCERVILLNQGRIVADGPTKAILRDRALLEANRLELPLRWQGE